MKKVDLIIAGAQKAGTTSLHNYLKSHPDLSGHSPTEFTFFTDEHEYKKGFEKAFLTYFKKKRYKAIVAKNVTLSIREEALIRLQDHNADVKIVFMMREPVSRAYSAYTMAVKDGWMHRPFTDINEVIHDRKFTDVMYHHFVGYGLYTHQLKTILKYFPPRNIRLYLLEDLAQHPQAVCNNIFDWLNVPQQVVHARIYNSTFQSRSRSVTALIKQLRNPNSLIKRMLKLLLPYPVFSRLGKRVTELNASDKKFGSIPEDSKTVLTKHFEKHNQELRDLLEQDEMKQCLVMYSRNSWLYPED